MTITSGQNEASSPTGPNSVRGNDWQCLSAQMASFTGVASQHDLRANLQFIHTGPGSKPMSSSLSVQGAEGSSPPGTPSPIPSNLVY